MGLRGVYFMGNGFQRVYVALVGLDSPLVKLVNRQKKKRKKIVYGG